MWKQCSSYPRPCPLLFSPLFRGNLKCHCVVISHLNACRQNFPLHSPCKWRHFTDIFRGTKQPQNATLYKRKALIADVSSDSWLIRIWLFLKSPNCPSLNAKSGFRVLLLAGFEFMHWISCKGDSEKLQTIPQDQHHSVFPAEILWENDCVLQKEAAQSVQKNHIYPSAEVLYASAVLGPDLPLHANFSKEKPCLFQISGEICFSKSARQADQIRFHLYWAWT